MGQIEGTLGILRNAGAPVNGTNEVQTLTIGGTPTGGTFKLAFEGQITAAITWSATTNTLLANIQAALRALATIGSAGVTCADGGLAGGIGDVTITFGGNLAKSVVPNISVDTNSLAGAAPTLAVAETTPGVTATGRGAAVGALLLDTTNAKLYKNDGTALEPTWNSVGDIATAEIADDAVSNAKLANMTRGTVKVGGASDAPTDLDAKTSGQILVGDGTDIKSVAVSGDISLAANGAMTYLAPLAGAVITVGAETGGNTINVGIQLKDKSNVDLAVRGSLLAYLSDDANGDSIATTAPSGAAAIGTDGLAIPLVANKAFQLVSEADGDIDLNIVEAAGATWYLILRLPNGLLVASAAITFAA